MISFIICFDGRGLIGFADALEMGRKGSSRCLSFGGEYRSMMVPPTEIRVQGVREQAGVPCM